MNFCYITGMKVGVKYGLYAAVFFLALGVSAWVTVVLVVKAPPEVEVPDLTGLEAIAALKALSDLGLNLKVQAADFSDGVPKDHVISQDPAAGMRLKRKRHVKVVLSKGSAAVPLPDLRGLSQKQAEVILNQGRLAVGQVSFTYGQGPEQGRERVLAQSPEPPASVGVGKKVDLLVSLGPRPVYLVMPDLTGHLYSVALINLERAGLVLGRLETTHLPSWPFETVVIQDPGPGSRVARGDLVRLTVNRADASKPADYQWRVFEYRIPYGLLRREINFRVALGTFLWDLHDDWHGPGEVVRLVTLVRGKPRGQVLEDGEETARFGEENIYEVSVYQ